MARHLQLKLPALKLTQRSASGSWQKKDILRGDSSGGGTHLHERDTSISKESDVLDFESGGGDDCEGPSLYKIQQRSSVAAWEKLRPMMLSAIVESSGMPPGQNCVKCLQVPALLRCRRCGPTVFFCHACFLADHSKSNLFHVAEEWKDGSFQPRPCEDRCITGNPIHECSTSKQVPLCCVDEDGLEHHIILLCCDCEPVSVTMTRVGIWPASPQFPQLAFTFGLLDWVEALMMECQVALKDLCAAIYFKCPYIIKKRRDIYRSMIDAVEEYRFMKHELRNLRFLCGGLDDGNICPACPKDTGKVIISMDALFGLPRKKAAGGSLRPPLHGHLFFEDQDIVDEYVNSASKMKSSSTKECSDFLAGSAIRSCSRFKALDETGVFGAVCRHEFPKRFYSLKHGERLAYGIWMLQYIQQQFCPVGDSIELFLMYDIACTLEKHLQNSEPDLLQNVHLVVPAFHSYGHKASCQVQYSPLRCPGIGLTDGEGTERLWSYLRRFSRMTKEMRPSHRIDVLSHALAYYAQRLKQKLGRLLADRLKRAQTTFDVAHSTLEHLTSALPNPIDDEDISKWMKEERASLLQASKSDSISWKANYFQNLQEYYTLRKSPPSERESGTESESACNQIKKLNRTLENLEFQHGVLQRWTPSDPEFHQLKCEYLKEKRKSLLVALHGASVRRKFLLQVKAKYADGQKIAKRVSTQISQETRRIKKLVEDCNAFSLDLVTPEITVQMALNPCELSSLIDCADVTGVKHDIIHAYLKKNRSAEEIELLKEDIEHTLQYFQQKRACIKSTCDDLSTHEDLFSRGAQNLLIHSLWEVELCIHRTKQALSVTPYYDSDSSTSDDDSDCDNEM